MEPKTREVRNLALPVGGVVLAAGLSAHMGRPKLLLKLGSKSIIRRVVENTLASRLAEIVVVVGREAARIREELVGLEVKIVENRELAKGQSGSLKLGLRALTPGTAALDVDTPEDYERLVALVERGDGTHS